MIPDGAQARFLQMDRPGSCGVAGERENLFMPDDLVAYYVFDDGALGAAVTAEDFSHRLDWDFALDGVTTTTNEFPDLLGIFDDDIDGLPNWYEDLIFNGSADPDGDPDGDGSNDSLRILR